MNAMTSTQNSNAINIFNQQSQTGWKDELMMNEVSGDNEASNHYYDASAIIANADS